MPSSQNQTVPFQHSDSSGSSSFRKKKEKAHGTCRKEKEKAYRQGFSKVYRVFSVSAAPSTSYTIATIMPQGLVQCIAVEEPETSSYRTSLYASFNKAMTLAQCLGDRQSSRMV
jgi:hypothetical protein